MFFLIHIGQSVYSTHTGHHSTHNKDITTNHKLLQKTEHKKNTMTINTSVYIDLNYP
jgi:hypothetical protein